MTTCVALKADGSVCGKAAKFPADAARFCGNHKYKLDGDKKGAPNSDKKEKETPNLVENGEEQAEAMLKDLFANDADKLLVITEVKDNGDVWFKVKMQSSDAQKDSEITSLKAQMAEMMKKMEAAGLGGTSAAAAAAPVAATPKGKDKKPVPVQ
tara:strand:- start:145 stop:606 length:462 start_codon:yes stop_codon:yes gene_type:complete